VESVADLTVAVETCKDQVLESKGCESKGKSASRQLDRLYFQPAHVCSEMVDIVKELFFIAATHNSHLRLSQSG
jgi:hypothetical protein